MLEPMARNRYPEAERLKQIKGVGTLIALAYMLTLEDPCRFRGSPLEKSNCKRCRASASSVGLEHLAREDTSPLHPCHLKGRSRSYRWRCPANRSGPIPWTQLVHSTMNQHLAVGGEQHLIIADLHPMRIVWIGSLHLPEFPHVERLRQP